MIFLIWILVFVVKVILLWNCFDIYLVSCEFLKMPKLNIKQTEYTIEGSMSEVINFTRLLTKPYGRGGRNANVNLECVDLFLRLSLYLEVLDLKW